MANDDIGNTLAHAYRASGDRDFARSASLFYDASVQARDELGDILLSHKYVYLYYIEKLKSAGAGSVTLIDDILRTLSEIAKLEDDRLEERIRPLMRFFEVLKYCTTGDMTKVRALLAEIHAYSHLSSHGQIESLTQLLAQSIVVKQNLADCAGKLDMPPESFLNELATLEHCIREKQADRHLNTAIRKILDAYHKCIASIRTSNISLVMRNCIERYMQQASDRSIFVTIAEDLREAIGIEAVGHLENTVTRKTQIPGPPLWTYAVSVLSGIVLIGVLLAIALVIENPTVFQFWVFRTTMALAAGGLGAAIPGFMRIDLPLWKKGAIHAGGALGLFIVTYLINPPALIAAR
jgi:hypothetical protein